MKTITIPSRVFGKNRTMLSQMLKRQSLAIFHSNDEMNRTADLYFPFRQHSDLFYLTGINQEKSLLLLAPDYPDASLREILIIRKSNPALETWEGHKLTREEAREISGIQNVRFEEDLDSLIAPLMMEAEHVYLNQPEFLKFIPDLPSRNLRQSEMLIKKFPAHQYERLAPLMSQLRVIKSDEEIALIRNACQITRDAFSRVLKTLRPGVTEYEIEAEITYEFLRQGARGHAYQPIIATGRNACVLHYVDNSKTCLDGELILMDFGAEYGNYAADCTRTIPVNGRFTDRQKDLYKAVYDVFLFACSLMKPGNTINNVHAEVCRRFGQEHIRLGLYTAGDLDKQDPKNPLYQKYYMHGTSHFLGLDVHDVGNKDALFQPGMVLTCEPGLYLESENTGIRLESNILITETGNSNLMEDIPMDPDEIEKLMRRDSQIP